MRAHPRASHCGERKRKSVCPWLRIRHNTSKHSCGALVANAVPWARRSRCAAAPLCFFQTHLSVGTVAETLGRREHFFGIKIQKLLLCQITGGNGSPGSPLISCEITDTSCFILNSVFEGRRRSARRDNGRKLISRLFQWFQENESPKARPEPFSEDSAEVSTVHGDTFSSTVAKSNSLRNCVPLTF